MSNLRTPLTQEEAAKIAEAYARFTELRNQKIKTSAAEAELTGLTEFLATSLIDHASEFIGCWFAVRNEYEVILGLLARVTQRVAGITRSQQTAMANPPAPTADGDNKSAPSNIVQLDLKD